MHFKEMMQKKEVLLLSHVVRHGHIAQECNVPKVTLTFLNRSRLPFQVMEVTVVN